MFWHHAESVQRRIAMPRDGINQTFHSDPVASPTIAGEVTQPRSVFSRVSDVLALYLSGPTFLAPLEKFCK